MADVPKSVITDGHKKAARDFQAENLPKRAGGSGWPMAPCFASGVNPEQAQELRDHFKRHGCPTEVTNDGDPVYRSPGHQKRALACRNMHNKAAC
jgi:hypothetical protein